MSRPDAVIVPRRYAKGNTDDERKDSIVEIAETLLECGPIELAWCHDQITYYFCTRDPIDTEYYHDIHPTKARKPRYEWTVQPDGTRVGYLLDDA